MSGLANDGTNRRITISNGGVGYDVGFRFNNVSNQIQVVSYINSSVVVNESYSLSDITVIKKYALKWGLNNYALWVNGVEVITNTSAISFPIGTLNTLNFASATNTNNFYGNVRSVAVFKEALTDEELAQITSATQQEVFYEMRDRMNIKNYDYYEFGDYTTRLKKLF